MHPATMQLAAEVRAQEMLLEARVSRPERGADKGAIARLRRIVPDLSSARDNA
jgi:hypothetical protein